MTTTTTETPITMLLLLFQTTTNNHHRYQAFRRFCRFFPSRWSAGNAAPQGRLSARRKQCSTNNEAQRPCRKPLTKRQKRLRKPANGLTNQRTCLAKLKILVLQNSIPIAAADFLLQDKVNEQQGKNGRGYGLLLFASKPSKGSVSFTRLYSPHASWNSKAMASSSPTTQASCPGLMA